MLLHFFFYEILSSHTVEKPPISIGNPTVTVIDKGSNSFSQSNDALNHLINTQLLNKQSATSFINKLKFSSKVKTLSVTFSLGKGNTPTSRTANRNSVIISGKNENGKLTLIKTLIQSKVGVDAKIIDITKKSKKLFGFIKIGTKKTVRQSWRPLNAKEITQVYNKISSKSDSMVSKIASTL